MFWVRSENWFSSHEVPDCVSQILLGPIYGSANFCLQQICPSTNIAQIITERKDCSARNIAVVQSHTIVECTSKLLVLHIIRSYIIATLRLYLSAATLYL